MLGLFSKPVAGSIKRCRPRSEWTPTQGLGIRLDTSTRRTGNTISTLLRNVLILLLCGIIAKDKLEHFAQEAWLDGYRQGYQQGFQKGMQTEPQVWKS